MSNDDKLRAEFEAWVERTYQRSMQDALIMWPGLFNTYKEIRSIGVGAGLERAREICAGCQGGRVAEIQREIER